MIYRNFLVFLIIGILIFSLTNCITYGLSQRLLPSRESYVCNDGEIKMYTSPGLLRSFLGLAALLNDLIILRHYYSLGTTSLISYISLALFPTFILMYHLDYYPFEMNSEDIKVDVWDGDCSNGFHGNKNNFYKKYRISLIQNYIKNENHQDYTDLLILLKENKSLNERDKEKQIQLFKKYKIRIEPIEEDKSKKKQKEIIGTERDNSFLIYDDLYDYLFKDKLFTEKEKRNIMTRLKKLAGPPRMLLCDPVSKKKGKNDQFKCIYFLHIEGGKEKAKEFFNRIE